MHHWILHLTDITYITGFTHATEIPCITGITNIIDFTKINNITDIALAIPILLTLPIQHSHWCNPLF